MTKPIKLRRPKPIPEEREITLPPRDYHGTYHHMSEKHLGCYVGEFSGRHNDRSRDTIDQMARIAQDMVGKRLSYRSLVAD